MEARHDRNRWKAEGVAHPSVVADAEWRCPVCSAGREELRFASDKIPEAVKCYICDLPFSMPHRNKANPMGCRPLVAVSDEWVAVWRLAYKDRLFRKESRVLGFGGYGRLLSLFSSAAEALMYFETQSGAVSS